MDMYWFLILVLVLILVFVFLPLLILIRLIGRKKPLDHDHPTESKRTWNAKFGSLIEEGEKWYRESPVEEWRIQSHDGLSLVGDFIPVKRSHRYVICVHGYTGDRTEVRRYGAVFSSWGINVLLPDNRAHGKSEGRWIGMGYLDSLDIREWVKTIVEKDPLSSIFLFGISMGGATVMMTSRLGLPENVRFFVEDCGYCSAWDEFALQLKKFHIPPVPFLSLASFWSRLFAGYSFREADVRGMLPSETRPFLFIHGKTDGFVPFFMLKECFQSSSSVDKKVLEVEGAGHALSVTKAREEYFSAIKTFVDEYMD